MNGTREDFCLSLLDADALREPLDPERLAARFVHYFGVSPRPTMDELRSILERAGFGQVSGRRLDVKGIHFSAPGGGYDILYRDGLWDGSSAHTVLHETYEIIGETLFDIDSGSPPDRSVCREADRFAAAVLMQPKVFEPLALQSGLDVLTLQRAFRCSYASVTIRLAETVKDPPLMAVLYERQETGDPADWADPPALRATVARRTRGFGPLSTRSLCGSRGGLPRRGKQLPPGSLAERAARSGTVQHSTENGVIATARPVFWKGKLAKVAVVAALSRGRSLQHSTGGCMRRRT